MEAATSYRGESRRTARLIGQLPRPTRNRQDAPDPPPRLPSHLGKTGASPGRGESRPPSFPPCSEFPSRLILSSSYLATYRSEGIGCGQKNAHRRTISGGFSLKSTNLCRLTARTLTRCR